MTNYAEVLESYLIAEEGLLDRVKNTGKAAIDALKRAIRWLREKIDNIISKIKNIRVYDSREIEQLSNKAKNEKLRADREAYRADNAERIVKDKVARNKELTEMYTNFLNSSRADTDTMVNWNKVLKDSIRLSGTITVQLNIVNKEVVKIFRELPYLRKFITTSSKVDLDSIETLNLRIKDELIDKLNEAVNAFLEYKNDEVNAHHVYCSVDLKTAAQLCLETLNKLLSEMEKIVDSLTNLNYSSQIEIANENYRFVIKTCNECIKSLTSIQSKISRIANLGQYDVYWVK